MRIGRSVIPAMGARNARLGNTWPPMLKSEASVVNRVAFAFGKREWLLAQ
jgi:hypothetical protein